MKIIVKSEDLPFNLKIPMPNSMLRPAIVNRFAELPEDLSPEALKQLRQCLRRMRKKYPGVPLIEVQSSSGDHVTIMP